MIVAGGHSNEVGLESGNTSQQYPWVASFHIDRVASDPVMKNGWRIQELPDHQVIDINQESINSTGYIFVNIQAISCASSPSKSYIVILSLADPSFFKAFPYTHDCASSTSQLNKLMEHWNDTFCYIGLPSITNNRFTLLSYSINGAVNWQKDSAFDGEVLALKLELTLMLFVVARRKSDNKVIISRLYGSTGQLDWTYALTLVQYNEAPMLVDYQYLSSQGRYILANKMPSGEFAINRMGGQQKQALLTQTASNFSHYKLRGQHIVDGEQVFLLFYDHSSSPHHFHMLKVNIYSKAVVFYSPTLPQMDLSSSTTACFFNQAASEYDYNRGFVIGQSFSGSLLKHNQGGSDAKISFSGGFTRGALLTNVQSLQCQVINPLDPTDSRLKLFDNKFIINELTAINYLFHGDYLPPQSQITLTNNVSVIYQPLIDANGIQKIDEECTVMVANGVSQASESVQKNLIEYEDMRNATRLDSIFTSLNKYSTSACSSDFQLLEYSLILDPQSASSYINITTFKPWISDVQSWLQISNKSVSGTVTAWVKVKATETNQIRYQKYLILISNPSKFIDHTINSVIANFTVNITKVQFQLPPVNLTPSTYANLQFSPNPINPPTLIQIVNSQIKSTSELFKIDIGPFLISQIGKYQVTVSLENDQGKRGPYLLNISVINTPPKFLGKSDMSVLGEVYIRLKEKEVLQMPDIFNLENQTLTLSLSDDQTGKTYPYIIVSKPDLYVLSFEPTDKEQVGDHFVRVVLSDDLGASTAYLLKMKILPLINKEAPVFRPVPEKKSFRVALGEKFFQKFDYLTQDPDPEYIDIQQSFKVPNALRQFMNYDAQTKILNCTIPLAKPPSITLNLPYSLLFTLNDQNPAGPKKRTYKFYLEVYDPNPAPQKIDVEKITLESANNQTAANSKQDNQIKGTIQLLKIHRNFRADIRIWPSSKLIMKNLTNSSFEVTFSNRERVNFQIFSQDSESGIIVISLSYANNSNISYGNEPDILKVSLNQEMIIDFASQIVIFQKGLISTRSIPPLLQDSVKFMAENLKGGRINLDTGLPSNIIISLVIQIVWIFLNDISFLTILCLISMPVPGIVQLTNLVFQKFIYIDVFYTEKWFPSLLSKFSIIQEDNGVNEFFEDNGFQSKILVMNLGSVKFQPQDGQILQEEADLE